MPKNHAAGYESVSNPTDDRVTGNTTQAHDSHLSISSTPYSGLSSPYIPGDVSGTPIDPLLAEWHLQGPHFPSVPNQVILDDIGQSYYGESEQIGAGSEIPDGLFSECLFPIESGDSDSSKQTFPGNPGFSNSQAPNQPPVPMYMSADDYIVLGQDDEVVDSSSDFLDAGLDSGYPILNLPSNTAPSRSDSGNSSEWSHLVPESDNNGRETSQPRTTETLSIPHGGNSTHTPSAPGLVRKRRPRGQFRTMELREKTSRTRKLGACIRCKMQRVRVRFPTGSRFMRFGYRHSRVPCFLHSACSCGSGSLFPKKTMCWKDPGVTTKEGNP